MLTFLALIAAAQPAPPPEDTFEAAGGADQRWRVYAGPGGFSLFERDDKNLTDRIFGAPRVVRSDAVTRLETRTSAGRAVTLAISNEVCRDGGSVFPYTARLEMDGAVGTGCAWGRVGQAPDERLPLGDYDLHNRIAISGTGPAWEGRVGRGGPNRIVINGRPYVEGAEAVPTISGTKAVYNLSGGAGRRARVTLEARACAQGGRELPFTVEVQAGNRRLRGCGSQTFLEEGPMLMTSRSPYVQKISGLIDNRVDYPEAALRAGASGRTMYEYLLDTSGRVAACAVRYSSGSTALDEATCRLVRERFRYEPMRDDNGAPTEYQSTESHEWVLPPPQVAPSPAPPALRSPPPPESPPTPPRQLGGSISNDDYPASAIRAEAEGTTVVALQVGENGRVTGCAVIRSAGDAALDSTTCSLAQRRFRYAPATREGRPVASSTTFTMRWVLPDD